MAETPRGVLESPSAGLDHSLPSLHKKAMDWREAWSKNRSLHASNACWQKISLGRHPSTSSQNFFYKAWTQSIPKAFQQCLNDRNRSKHFRVTWSQRESRSVGRLGTYKLMLLQALSLTTGSFAWHPTYYPKTLFLCGPPFWSQGPKYAPMAARQSQSCRLKNDKLSTKLIHILNIKHLRPLMPQLKNIELSQFKSSNPFITAEQGGGTLPLRHYI